jgi:probable phosphoglycerate mutase
MPNDAGDDHAVQRGQHAVQRGQEATRSAQDRGALVLVLVRHGQTEWSRDGRHTSRTDLPLTGYGEEQAAALAPVLAAVGPVLVLTSPMQRTRRTAELAGLPAKPDPDLTEWQYGDYEGLTTPQIHQDRPGWTIWTGDPPGGETAGQVGARADRVLARAATALPSGPVVLVTHGHLGRVIAARYLGLPVDHGRLFALGPAAPCLLGLEHEHPVIQRWNLPNPLDER